MNIIKILSRMKDEGCLEDFIRLCEKITVSNGGECFAPNMEMAFGLVRRTGDLYEAGELNEDDFMGAAAFACDLSDIPVDLLLIDWAARVASRMNEERIQTSEKDDNEHL
jgi:hypothetical protein